MPWKICESSIFTTYHKEFWFSANFIFTLFSIFLFLIKLDRLPVPLKKANTKLLLANIMHIIKLWCINQFQFSLSSFMLKYTYTSTLFIVVARELYNIGQRRIYHFGTLPSLDKYDWEEKQAQIKAPLNLTQFTFEWKIMNDVLIFIVIITSLLLPYRC